MATNQYVRYPSTGGSGSGVSSLNGLTGAVLLAAGSNITLTPSGNTITIASTGGGGSGTVTSVALADSTGLFNITGSPVTTSGTLTLASFQSQAQHSFFAGPSGSAGAPAFRAIVASDVPTLNQNTTGTASNITASSNSTLTTLSALSLPAAQLTGLGNLTDAGTDGIVVTGGIGAVIGSGTSLAQHVADATHNGYLSSADWNTFNSASGAAITSLTGDVTATGPGAATATLATVNGNVGTFGSSTSIPTFTVNAKGLITAASGNAVIAPAGTLIGTTLASNVVTSSLTILGTQSVALNMGAHLINAVTDPVSAQDAATKNYVDTVASGLQPIQGVQAASTANISGTYNNGAAGIGATFTTTSTATFTLDGYTPALTERVLLKNQTSGFQNGVYNVTQLATGILPAILTRSLDYNTASDMNAGNLVPVINGTVNGETSWLQTATITTVGTDPLVYVLWTANPFNYLLKVNNLSDVSSLSTSFNNISPVTTTGDIIYSASGATNTRLPIGSSGQVLTVSAGVPAWSAAATGTVTSVALTVPAFLNVTGSPVTSSGTLAVGFSGTALPVANGGTGDTSFTANQVVLGGTTTTAPLAQVPGGTSGYVLTSNGTTAAPTFQPAPGTVSAFYASSQVTTSSSGITSTSFTTFSNSPAFSFTPSITGTYKVYSSAPIEENTSGTLAVIRILNTVNGSSVLTQSLTSPSNVGSGGAPSGWTGQSFTPTSTGNLGSIVLKLEIASGSGQTGNLVVDVYSDNAGNPGTLLETSSAVNSASITGTPTNFTFNFAGTTSLSSSTLYHLVLNPTAVTFNGANIAIGFDGTNPYAGGYYEFSSNSGSTWTPNTSDDLYFIVNTAGTATLLEESQGIVEISGSFGASSTYVQSVYTLVAGNSYTFDLQGKVTSTGIAICLGASSNFYMFAELEATGSLPLQVSSINSLSGAITLAAGANTTITPSGNTLTFASTGTVTSVALADGSTSPIYSVSGSPVTSSGTLTFSLANQTANTIFSGPSTGSPAQPTFRSLVNADVGTLTVANITASTNSTLTTLSALSLPTSQLSGSVSLTTQVSGVLPVANGGTDNGTLPVTAGGVIYTDGTRLQNVGAGTASFVLTSNGASPPTWQASGGGAGAAVAASYYASANGTWGTANTLNFDTQIYDTNSAVTASPAGTGSWVFTAPVTGYYSIQGQVVDIVGGNDAFVYINGTIYAQLCFLDGTSGTGTMSYVISLNSGDTFDIRRNSTGTYGGGTLSGTNSTSKISINLIK